MAVTAQADEVHRVISTAFDPLFYRAVNPELVTADFDPLAHYLGGGWREGRDPAPWFSVEAYLAANTDVRRSKADPFFHFLTIGRREGREVVPSRQAERYLQGAGWSPEPWSFEALVARPPPPPAPGADAPEATATEPADPDGPRRADEALAATEFDPAYYLAANPDVDAAGVDPLQHFLTAGWREGRNPNRRFSVADYLEANPDVAAAGVNPFVHYLRAGRAEGRIPRHDLGFRYDVLARLVPPEARAAEAARATAERVLDPADVLAKALAGAATGLKDLHVTFSHDDFSANFGGVQLCLQRESARLAEAGIDHLHLYPAAFWPVLRERDDPGALGVLLNGRRVGVFALDVVRSVAAKAAGRARPGRRSFAIHNLLGHSVDETADLLQDLGLTEGYFWVHDFASLCAGFHLLRNDVEDCAAPPPDSPACSICAYGSLRARHLDSHRRLFERLMLTVVAPSQTTLDFWRASWDFPHKDAVVLPHAMLADRGPAPVGRKRRPFRVAFVGMPVPLKGWPIFKALAERFEGDKRYEFLHLGGQDDPATPAAFHPVVVSEDRPRAMQETLEDLQVDAALIWPLCRETFSFTAYEAAAAGAAVITGPDSGNVAAFVAESGLGRVLETEAALAEAFETGEVLALGRARRKARLYDLTFSGLTVDLLRTGR